MLELYGISPSGFLWCEVGPDPSSYVVLNDDELDDLVYQDHLEGRA